MKKHITIGIAGHVDHGKTSLVKAMTGIDTDRLREEKRRGLSIESGIASMILPSGEIVALVDVPGHTDFLKNTIRGLSGVDAAVLVVAADDGVMPQTREHVEILRFFGAQTGFVVLSKADLVDGETLELAELEISELVEGTFLEKSPIIPFSAVDLKGLEEIRAGVAWLAETSSGKNALGTFRLWIDQVKSFPGFGTVASGTVASGKLTANDPVQILPGGIATKARSLESHHHKVDRVEAGQRVGVNLPKISAHQVGRGMVLTEPGFMMPGFLLNVDIRIPASAKGSVKNRQKVKLYLGSSLANATVVLMGMEDLSPGEEGLAQLRLNKPVAAIPGDPFVLCLLNIHTIVGGGKVLEITREKYREAKMARVVPRLKALRAGEVKAFMDYLLRMAHSDLLEAEKLMAGTGLPLAAIQEELEARVASGELLSFGTAGGFPNVHFLALKKKAPEIVANIFSRNPLKQAATPEEIKQQLAPGLDDRPFRRILSELTNEGSLIKLDGGFRVPKLSIKLSEDRERLLLMLLEYARESGLVPFSADTFWKLHRRQHNKNEIQRLLDYLHVQGKLIRLNNRRFMTPEAMEEIRIRVKELVNRKGLLTLGDSKEVLGYGRTVGVPVFEYLDSIGFTNRDGDARTLR